MVMSTTLEQIEILNALRQAIEERLGHKIKVKTMHMVDVSERQQAPVWQASLNFELISELEDSGEE